MFPDSRLPLLDLSEAIVGLLLLDARLPLLAGSFAPATAAFGLLYLLRCSQLSFFSDNGLDFLDCLGLFLLLSESIFDGFLGSALFAFALGLLLLLFCLRGGSLLLLGLLFLGGFRLLLLLLFLVLLCELAQIQLLELLISELLCQLFLQLFIGEALLELLRGALHEQGKVLC